MTTIKDLQEAAKRFKGTYLTLLSTLAGQGLEKQIWFHTEAFNSVISDYKKVNECCIMHHDGGQGKACGCDDLEDFWGECNGWVNVPPIPYHDTYSILLGINPFRLYIYDLLRFHTLLKKNLNLLSPSGLANFDETFNHAHPQFNHKNIIDFCREFSSELRVSSCPDISYLTHLQAKYITIFRDFSLSNPFYSVTQADLWIKKEEA